MRIGIITIHHVTNFGAVMQNYALTQALKRHGVEVETIDYRPAIAVEKYKPKLLKRGIPAVRGYLRHRAFQSFISNHLPLSKKRYATGDDLREGASHYDVLVCGSDQIWCVGAGSFRGYDPNFFLDIGAGPAVRKFSYAASAGDTTDFDSHSGTISSALSGFTGIAVRDEHTAALIQRTTGRRPVVVLDPVFLHDFNELVHDVRPTNDLVVFSSRPDRLAPTARALADEFGMRVVSLVHPFSGADRVHRVLSPVDWIRQLRGARAVLTDYFHGLAVSMRFGRPVLVDPAPGKANKIEDLLRRVGMESFEFDPKGPVMPVSLVEAVRNPDAYQKTLRARLEGPESISHEFIRSIVGGASVQTQVLGPAGMVA